MFIITLHIQIVKKITITKYTVSGFGTETVKIFYLC